MVLFFTMPELRAETTIYVGQHFEVRDLDQPTKYVFNGSTRVARITGSLSTHSRIQRVRLRSGWNLLSLAVSANDLSGQLQRPGVVVSARWWNPQTGNYAPVPQAAPAGTVLWVNATTNATIAVVGSYSDPINRQIATGATYLASTGLEAWTPNFPLTLAAWSFDPQPSTLNPQPAWLARLTGDLSSVNELPRTFAPGDALYVIADTPFELEVPDPALRIRYFHQDHVGSSSVMTDANGALVEETAFYPFGIPRHEYRLRQVEEAYKFTQKERDRETGLHYFESRYLAGGLARFTTQDPMYANPDALAAGDAAAFLATPQKMNMYAYARNNPLNYTDPTGLEDEKWDDWLVDDEKDGGGSGFADTIVNLGRQGVSFVVGASDELTWGMGSSYQVLRPVLVEGYKVDPDSAGYTGGKVFGKGVNIAATLMIPGPKGPVPAPGTVTLFAKTPVVPAILNNPTIASRPGTPAPVPARIEPNTSVRVGNLNTVPRAESITLIQTANGQRVPSMREIHMSDPAKAAIIQRLDANRATLDRLNAEGRTGEAGDLLRKIFNGGD
jgi:RHS repeat-associated protein